MKISALAIVGLAALSLAGCGSSGSKETAPVAAAPAVAAPPTLGPTIAGALGSNLDEADTAAAAQAQVSAFEAGQRKAWRGKRAYGYVEAQAEFTDSRGTCRNFSHTVYIDGRPKPAAQAVACRGADGVWKAL